jgi:DNA-binding transcriptional regulator PaaX
MRASTEEFLYVLLFLTENLMRPTNRNLTELDFEGWAWRNGLARRLAQLERQRLVAPHPAKAAESKRIVLLTETGRLAALGGRDPAAWWARPLDGRWRIVVFDLPRDSTAVRSKFHRLLRQRHFGFLQGSVWLTPDPTDDLRRTIAGTAADPEGFLVIEGRPASGDTDDEIVQGAWDFAEINRRYDRHLDHLRTPPKQKPCTWLSQERALWNDAVRLDPLLPFPLIPASYRGRAAWAARHEALAATARRLRSESS